MLNKLLLRAYGIMVKAGEWLNEECCLLGVLLIVMLMRMSVGEGVFMCICSVYDFGVY